MASAVYSEPPASRLSIALEGEASASPFPSPSSSFLPPPTPGAHEFAVKPVSNTRIGRKHSATAHIATNTTSITTTMLNGDTSTAPSPAANGHIQPPTDISDVSISAPSTTETPQSKQDSTTGQSLAEDGQTLAPPSEIFISAPGKDKDLAPPPLSPVLISPTTPTPYKLQHHALKNLEPPHSPGPEQSTSSATTPTIITSTLPLEDRNYHADEEAPLARITIPSSLEAGLSGAVASSPNSPAFSTFSNASGRGARPISISGSPSSSRPAPPSPALSRRVSGVPSGSRLSGVITTGSNTGGSRPPSQAVSRAGSLRKPKTSSARASPVLAPHRLSQSFGPPPPVSPHALAFALSASGGPSSSSRPVSVASASGAALVPLAPVVYIKVRDFGFPASDARHIGLGPDVPRANEIVRLNKRLARRSLSGESDSGDSYDGDGGDEDGDDDGQGGWDGGLLGRWSWVGVHATSASGSATEGGENGDRPSQSVLEMNFEQEEEEEEEEEPLYPGIYRAMFAFEPEGTAEMRLEEDQLVRVVGRGGGVGWAIVVDESAVPTEEERKEAQARGETIPVRHALVPEGYLEAVRLDWEEEEAAENARLEGEDNASVRVAA